MMGRKTAQPELHVRRLTVACIASRFEPPSSDPLVLRKFKLRDDR